MTLQRKLLVSKLSLAIIPLAVTSAVLLWRANTAFRDAVAATETALKSNSTKSRDHLIAAAAEDLTHVAKNVYATCQAQQELLQQKVTFDLNVARECLQRVGKVGFAAENVTWDAVDQTSGKPARVELPRMQVGETWLGQNNKASVASPIVDEVRKLVGSNCTIFQRMNEAGDMLRVSTNVQKEDGTRAIGTYIAAVTADKTANPVIATVLKGEPFLGRAFVVGQWCVSAYEPILDEQKKVIGMLFVGVPEQSAKSLRQALMSVTVGRTGYVFILNATGSTKGAYVLSQGGKRDGENIWNAKDASGQLFIQNMCETAVALQPGEVGEIRYPWKNAQDSQPRDKITKLAYFAPWDWVIGVGAYEDEFYQGVRELDQRAVAAVGTIRAAQADAARSVKAWSLTIGIGAALVAVCVTLLVTRGISRVLLRAVAGLTEGANQVHAAAAQVAGAGQQLAAGANEQAGALQETSTALLQMTTKTQESSEHAAQANALATNARGAAENGGQTMSELNQAMVGINDASEKVSKIIKVIEEIAFQTNLLALNAAVEAARAGEHGKGFAVVAEEVRSLAQRAGQAAKETTALIETAVTRARQGNEVANQAAQALSGIISDVARVSQLLEAINTASSEQAHGVQEMSQAVNSMEKVTQANAAGAEESAAAAEELSAQAGSMLSHINGLAAFVGARQA